MNVNSSKKTLTAAKRKKMNLIIPSVNLSISSVQYGQSYWLLTLGDFPKNSITFTKIKGGKS